MRSFPRKNSPGALVSSHFLQSSPESSDFAIERDDSRPFRRLGVLPFFVTRAGECIFPDCDTTSYRLDEGVDWIHHLLHQARQPEAVSSHPSLQEIGTFAVQAWLLRTLWGRHLESSSENDDGIEPSTFNIVDLNVRTSGSLVLGLMRGSIFPNEGACTR